MATPDYLNISDNPSEISPSSWSDESSPSEMISIESSQALSVVVAKTTFSLATFIGSFRRSPVIVNIMLHWNQRKEKSAITDKFSQEIKHKNCPLRSYMSQGGAWRLTPYLKFSLTPIPQGFWWGLRMTTEKHEYIHDQMERVFDYYLQEN